MNLKITCFMLIACIFGLMVSVSGTANRSPGPPQNAITAEEVGDKVLTGLTTPYLQIVVEESKIDNLTPHKVESFVKADCAFGGPNQFLVKILDREGKLLGGLAMSPRVLVIKGEVVTDKVFSEYKPEITFGAVTKMSGAKLEFTVLSKDKVPRRCVVKFGKNGEAIWETEAQEISSDTTLIDVVSECPLSIDSEIEEPILFSDLYCEIGTFTANWNNQSFVSCGKIKQALVDEDEQMLQGLSQVQVEVGVIMYGLADNPPKLEQKDGRDMLVASHSHKAVPIETAQGADWVTLKREMKFDQKTFQILTWAIHQIHGDGYRKGEVVSMNRTIKSFKTEKEVPPTQNWDVRSLFEKEPKKLK